MGVLVVVEEFRHSIVMASSNHPRRSLLQSNCSDSLASGTTAGWHKTYISSHTSACRRCSAHSSPRRQSDNHQDNHTRGRTHQHLLILANTNPLPLNNLEILQTAEDLMLDLEYGLDAEIGPLLDRERLVLQPVERARSGQVDDDIIAALDLQCQRLDDAFSRVVRVGNRRAGVQAQRRFPPVQGLVVLVCWGVMFISLCTSERKEGRGGEL